MTAALLALLLASSPDPCAPVTPAASPDPEAAAAYRAVAASERAAGRLEPAVAAYRAAAERDPADAASRASLAALCRGPDGETPFERGARLVQADDCDHALPELETALAGGELAAALLAGICRYERGDDGVAELHLRLAQADPATRATARFFLGLIALRTGRAGEAVSLLDDAAGDERLAPFAGPLARTARRSGTLLLSLAAEGGWDSNVDLAPGSSAAPSGSSDGTAGLAAALSWAPSTERGPHARAAASLTEQFRLDAFDVDGAALAAGWRFGRATRGALVEAGWEWSRLGGDAYVSAPRLLAAARTRLGGWDAGLSYEARLEDFRGAAAAPYDGLRQELEGELSRALAGGVVVTAAWRAERDGGEEAALAYWETGPRFGLRRAFTPRVRGGLELAGAARRYGAEDPVFEELRSDLVADLGAALEVDLTARLTLRVACFARRSSSSVDGLSYRRVVPTVALTWTRGLR